MPRITTSTRPVRPLRAFAAGAMIATSALALSAGPGRDAPAQESAKPDAAAGRLEVMKRAVGHYAVRPAGGVETTYRLRTEPVLRFTNTVGQSADGAVFVWTGEGDRAVAAVQVFQRRDGLWIQELSSLSPRPPLAACRSGPDWNPEQAGVEFQDVPGAPRPAATAGQRLVQIRALARRFVVEDDFQRKSWQSLRMLATPLLRYGKPDADPIDGALLAYVLTTDPEALLMLEARADGGPVRWRYAFAPMTIYPLRATVEGREVWSLDHRATGQSRGPSAAFHVRRFEPEG